MAKVVVGGDETREMVGTGKIEDSEKNTVWTYYNKINVPL